MLTNNSKEIFILTCTQVNLSYFPNSIQPNAFKLVIKVEGLILEGLNEDEQLISIVASEHLGNSPAYFFHMEYDKRFSNSEYDHKFFLSLNTLECIYNIVSFFPELKNNLN